MSFGPRGVDRFDAFCGTSYIIEANIVSHSVEFLLRRRLYDAWRDASRPFNIRSSDSVHGLTVQYAQSGRCFGPVDEWEWMLGWMDG